MSETAGAKRSRITWSPEERAEWLWRSQMPEVIDEPTGTLVEVVPRLTPPPSPTAPVVASSAVSSDRAVVQLPSGWRIEVPVGADAARIRDLLQALVAMKA